MTNAFEPKLRPPRVSPLAVIYLVAECNDDVGAEFEAAAADRRAAQAIVDHEPWRRLCARGSHTPPSCHDCRSLRVCWEAIRTARPAPVVDIAFSHCG